MQSKPNWQDLAELWMTTHYLGKPSVVILKPFSELNDMTEKVGVLLRLSAFDPEAVSSEFVVSPQETLMFAMVWDGSAFTDEGSKEWCLLNQKITKKNSIILVL